MININKLNSLLLTVCFAATAILFKYITAGVLGSLLVFGFGILAVKKFLDFLYYTFPTIKEWIDKSKSK